MATLPQKETEQKETKMNINEEQRESIRDMADMVEEINQLMEGLQAELAMNFPETANHLEAYGWTYNSPNKYDATVVKAVGHLVAQLEGGE